MPHRKSQKIRRALLFHVVKKYYLSVLPILALVALGTSLLISSLTATAEISNNFNADGSYVDDESFSYNEAPVFKLDAKGAAKSDEIKSGKGELTVNDGTKIVARAIRTDMSEEVVPEIISQGENDEFSIDFNSVTSYKPGKYRLFVEINNTGDTERVEKDFTWGVLALNLDQSTYKVQETANIGIGVLDDEGITVCDAKLELRIKNIDFGSEEVLSTENQSIQISDTCANGNVTNIPDYSTSYVPKSEGTYQIELKAETANGIRTTSQSFEVINSPDFVTKRFDTSMRIFPPSPYTVNIEVFANKDIFGGIKEKVPASFEIQNIKYRIENSEYRTEKEEGTGTVSEENGAKIIDWIANLNAGESIKLSYEYNAPDISPEFYLLGPLEIWQATLKDPVEDVENNKINKIKNNEDIEIANNDIELGSEQHQMIIANQVEETTVFVEPRPWQIVADTLTSNIHPTAYTLTTGFNNNFSTTPQNAYSSDNQYASITDTKPRNEEYATNYRGFDFSSIPDGSNINSVNVYIERKASIANGVAEWRSSVWADVTVAAALTAGTIGAIGPDLQYTTTTNPTSDTYWFFALTGTLPTVAELKGTNFGIRAQIANGNSGTAVTYYLDDIYMVVDYTAPATIDISGTVYGTDESTPVATGPLVRIKVNGAGDYSANANGSGVYTITNVSTATAGTAVTVYLDTGGGITGTTFTIATGSSMADIHIYQDRASTRCDNSCSLTNTNINAWDKSDDSDIHMEGSTGTVDNDWKLRISTQTYAPGGSVTMSTGGGSGYSGDVEIKSGATLDMSTNALSISGNYTNGGTATLSSNTTSFTKTSGTQTLISGGTGAGYLFNNLTMSGAGTLQLSTNALQVDGTLTVSAGTMQLSTLSISANGATSITGVLDDSSATGTNLFVGLITINAGGSWTSTGNSAYEIRGGITNGQTFSGGTGNYTFTTNSQNISGSSAMTFGGAVSISGAITITNQNTSTVTITGSLDGDNASSSWTNAANSTLNYASTTAIFATNGVLTATASPNTVNYNASSGGQTVKSTTYDTLILGNTLGTDTAGSTITINSGLTTTSGGTLDMSTYQLLGVFTPTNNGTITTSSTADPAIPTGQDWTGTDGLVQFAKTDGGQFVPAGIYGILTFSNTSNNNTARGALATTTLNTTASGTLDMVTYALTVTTPNNSGTLQTQNTTATPISTGKTWGGTVQYDSTVSGQTVVDGTYNNLIITKTAETATLGGAIIVSNDLTIISGVLNTGTNYDITIAGNWSNSGTFTPNSGTVFFNKGSSTQTLNSGGTGAGKIFNNLTHSGAGTLQLITNAINIDGVFTNSNGTFDANDLNMNVADDFLISSGSFSADVSPGATTQTVTFDGTNEATVSGSNTFYNLTMDTNADGAKTIKFTASSVQTISNVWTLDGAFGKILTLNSTVNDTAWEFVIPSDINPSGDYITVRDSQNNTNAYRITAGSNCTNSGNNDPGWIFDINTAPNDPTSLAQKKTDDTVLNVGDWTDETSVKFTASVDDTDNPDTLYLCVEKDAIGVAFSGTEDLCGSGVAYSGSPVAVTVTITSQTDDTEYHWQARTKDEAGEYSSWVAYGGNSDPNDRDYGIDTSAPTGGTVNDGVGADIDYNNGSLSTLSANWSSIDSTVSGLNKFEYAIGTTQGATDTKTWTDNSTTANVTDSALTLRTGQKYYFTIRATDNAGNVSTPINSDGQAVAPTLTFEYFSGSTITFDVLNSGNSWTDSSKTTVLQTSTNAYGGYVIKARAIDELRISSNPTLFFSHYADPNSAPTVWTGTGFGYTTSDDNLSGGSADRFTNGGPKYAGWTETGPGDPVADHTATVSGSPISNEQFTITYRVSGDALSAAGTYQTTIVYTCIPQY